MLTDRTAAARTHDTRRATAAPGGGRERGRHVVAVVLTTVLALLLPALGATPAQAATLPLPAGNAAFYLAYSTGAPSSITGSTGGVLDTQPVCAGSCSTASDGFSGAFYDAATASIYAAGANVHRFTLYRVPVSGPDAGNVSTVGFAEDIDVYGLARGPQGAFALGSTGGFATVWSVDLATGALTPIGEPTLPGIGTLNGFAYSAASSSYYAMTRDSGNLYSVDVTTGTFTLVGSTGLSGSYSLQADSGGTLWNLEPNSVISTFTVSGSTISTPVEAGHFAGFTTTALVLDAPQPARTVTYDGNGSTGGSAPVDVDSPYASGSTVTALVPGTLTRTGYQFAAWYTTPAWDYPSTKVYKAGDTFAIAGDTTLYAHWVGGPLEFRSTPLGTASTTYAFPDATNGQTQTATIYVRNVGAERVMVSNVTPNGSGVSVTGGTCSTSGGYIQPYDDGATPDCTYVFSWTASNGVPTMSYDFSVNYQLISSTLALTGQVLQAGRTPTFSTPVGTADGFTVDVTNYDAAWTWDLGTSAGSVVAGSPVGTTLPLTVTGLSAGAGATVTVTTTRSGWQSGTATVDGTADDVPPVTAPPAPSWVRVTVTSGTATVRVYPGSPNGVAVTSYTVTLPGTRLHCTIPAGTTSCRITGLPMRSSYAFAVVAVGPTGHSATVVGTAVMTSRTSRTATYFAAGSALLGRTMRARLAAFVAKLPHGATVVTVDVLGYVQGSRNRANDRTLSLARARAVAAYLASHGVKARISVHGRGILGRTPWSRAAVVTLVYAVQRPLPVRI